MTVATGPPADGLIINCSPVSGTAESGAWPLHHWQSRSKISHLYSNEERWCQTAAAAPAAGHAPIQPLCV